ncbi:NAD(P)H-binding protein [Hydrogenophaga sp. XSHU_21]
MSELHRSSDSTVDPAGEALRVLLLGASGFIGSHVLAALCARGASVTGVCRRPPQARPALSALDASITQGIKWKVMGLEQALMPARWAPLLANIDVVINCVGILRQRSGESYEDVHHRMPGALARACADLGVRLIHTSALGLHENARSRFLSSKLRGEHAVKESGADHCIVRPSLIDGRGGFGASWLRMIARSPVQLVPTGATGRIAAVRAVDLGEAYARLARMPSLEGWREANLGGMRHFQYGEYLQHLRGAGGASPERSPALQVPLPDWATRVGAHLCDLFRFSPFSYGHWILLQRDNLPIPNALPTLLGREPAPVTPEDVAWTDDFRLS